MLNLLILCGIRYFSLSDNKLGAGLPSCNLIRYTSIRNATFSTFVFAFTFVYLIGPMIKNGDFNVGLFLGLFSFFGLDVYVKYGICGFYLDYLQLVEPTKIDKAKPKIEQMTNISKTLKAICKRQKVFGVVVSSLSRATEGRSDHRPIMSDLRETGQLEFDADKIGFVYRPYEHDRNQPADLMEVIVRKNRNGSLGIANIQCHLPYTKANEYPPNSL